ncbi:MocR-like pyridoxine biosynthesis transcription factor PdxR [Nitrincola iocasae]|uniref:PLP-dependent aminotransferase family protein n=1 Tax=Nitrincola iocasae TaxID=2614693 RepID=A0A5J6LAD3_9GAMM|nr:PLP-dependent aminotransferase family protein [Nitrincola iocasae]QEW05559.1 PLP-dependent aminotransferase family protein [Nitrincola iocasae]
MRLPRTPFNPMADPSLPRYRQVFAWLQQAILNAELKSGEQLPATRDLARQLGLSRNTVKEAYELLQAEGYIEARQGAGSFVVELPAHLLRHAPVADPDVYPQQALPDLNHRLDALQAFRIPETRVSQRLQPALPALDAFPLPQWKRCLNQSTSRPLLQHSPLAGEPLLRDELVKHLAMRRGIQVDASQLLITSGSQQALHFVAELLLGSGDKALVESPGYPGTAAVMRAAGAKVESISWQSLQQGLPSGLVAKCLCVTPSRNFPLGHTLTLTARLALLNWAEQQRCWIIEDDFDCEFATGQPITALYALSRKQRVIYTGTFSRTMFPSLRLGYLVLPPALVPGMLKLRGYQDGGLTRLPQHALGQFMAEGHYSRHLKKMRQLYQQRREALMALISASPLSELPMIDAGGGMHLVQALPPDHLDQPLCQRLNNAGIGARPLSAYDPLTDQQGLILGFSADPVDRMAQAVSHLVRAYSL